MSPKSIARPLDIYIRVSDVRGRAGESFISPKDQEERCRAALKAKGLEAGEIITDLDVSGGKMERPGLDEVIGRIRGEQSGGVVVARIDRFGRTVVGALQVMQEIDEAGGVVITAEGDFDTSTAVGELVLNFMLSLAQFELRRIRENWQGAKRRAVERGIHITRHVPPGYTRGEARRLGAHADFAEPIREAFRLAAVGEPYARIAAHLNEHQVPSGDKAVVWQANRIKRLLANRVYLGEARSGNGHVNAEAHEALTDEATWLLAQRTPRLAVTTGSETLLAGLCRCASCSFSMKGNIEQNRRKRASTDVQRRLFTAAATGPSP